MSLAFEVYKHCSSLSFFQYSTVSTSQCISCLVICDLNSSLYKAQLRYVSGLLIGEVSDGYIFRTVSWSSQKWCHRVQSIDSEEMIAAGTEIHEVKILALSLYFLYMKLVPLPSMYTFDCREIYPPPSTKRKFSAKCIRAYVNVRVHEREHFVVPSFIWVPQGELRRLS